MGEDSGSVTPQPELDSSGAARSEKPGRQGSELTPAAFEALLLWLDPDRDRAGERYEKIRHKLIIFFTVHGGLSPEYLTDKTINVVAGKVMVDQQARASQPEAYFMGVACNILKEDYRNRDRKNTGIESLPPYLQPTVNPSKDREEEEQGDEAARKRALRDQCARRCLGELKTGERELMIEYSSGGDNQGDKKRQRRKMAERLGISTKALTNRMARIRKWLIDCRAKCVAEKQTE